MEEEMEAFRGVVEAVVGGLEGLKKGGEEVDGVADRVEGLSVGV